MPNPPLVVLIPSSKLIAHEATITPGWPRSEHGQKKGTYPLHALVEVHCTEKGVYVSIDVDVWVMGGRFIRANTPLGIQYDAELRQVLIDGGRAAGERFPVYAQWLHNRRLAERDAQGENP